MLVHAVTEAHELHFAGFDTLDEFRNFLNGTDFHQHVENFFIGAAVKRAVERGNSRRRGGVGVDMRTAHAANRVRRAVLLVVRVKNKENVQSALERGVRPVLGF